MQRHMCMLHTTSAPAVSVRPGPPLLRRRVDLQQNRSLQRSRSQRSPVLSSAHSYRTAEKTVWVQTTNLEVLTSAVESGISTFLFPTQHQHLVDEWQGVVQFDALHCQGDTITSDGSQVGRIKRVSSADEMRLAAQDCSQPGYMVMDCSDWQIIPAENLVAAFQDKPASLLGLATSAEDARVMLEALEAGTSGVVLKTEDPLQARKLAAYLKTRSANRDRLAFEVAKVTSVQKGVCGSVLPAGPWGGHAGWQLCTGSIPGSLRVH
ncbi:hypothetical protein ABBQ38_002882 [Trebouxia sp. C0009 RCD-2024]